MRRSFCASARRRLACHHPSNRAEHLLIYRIQSHTNPKRRKSFLKQAGQKSSKEELPEHWEALNRAQKSYLKGRTYFWEQDAAGSNPVTRTTFLRKTAYLGGFSTFFVLFFVLKAIAIQRVRRLRLSRCRFHEAVDLLRGISLHIIGNVRMRMFTIPFADTPYPPAAPHTRRWGGRSGQ